MNNSIDFTQPGGLFVYQDTLKFLQDAYAGCFDAIAAMYGDKVIIQGLVQTGGSITDGWVIYNGQLIPVTGGAVNTYLHLNTTVTQEQYADGLARNCYTVKNFVFTATSGGNVAFNTFKRLPYNTATIYDAFNQVKSIFQKIINLDNAVILSGCVVSSVTGTTSGTATISAGVVLMDGEIVNAPLRTAGAWPCWLKPDGTYATSDPGGTNVLFDYETSQRYTHVLKRATHESGEVVMSRSEDDLALFDAASGLGKWKWLGWQIDEESRSRFLVGYDNRTSLPVGDDGTVWDSEYNTVNNFNGSNELTLVQGNLPNVKLKIEKAGGGNYVNDTAGGGSSTSLKGDTDNDSANPLETEALGNDDPIDIRPGRSVMLFIERI